MITIAHTHFIRCTTIIMQTNTIQLISLLIHMKALLLWKAYT